MLVNLLQYSYGIGIVDEPVRLFMGSELGPPLWVMIDSDLGHPFVLLLIVDSLPGLR